jgi:hypothetical protein
MVYAKAVGAPFPAHPEANTEACTKAGTPLPQTVGTKFGV